MGDRYFKRIIDNAQAEAQQSERFLRDSKPDPKRLDVSADLLKDWPEWRKDDFIEALSRNGTISTVHLNGHLLDQVLSDTQIVNILQAIGRMNGVTEYFIFRGRTLNENVLARNLPPYLHMIILRHFSLANTELAEAFRDHPKLSHITLFLPASRQPITDADAMALRQMKCLEVLQIRCFKVALQPAPCISPQALSLLIRSKSMKSLYLDNCCLLQDHIDLLVNVLRRNTALTYLSLTDDVFHNKRDKSRLMPLMLSKHLSVDVAVVKAPSYCRADTGDNDESDDSEFARLVAC